MTSILCLQDDSRGFVAKVSDFGLSKLLPENNAKGSFPAEQAPAGTVTHMSPEALSEGALSTAGDVYAFGIMSKSRCSATCCIIQ